jgi:hypothetical protein
MIFPPPPTHFFFFFFFFFKSDMMVVNMAVEMSVGHSLPLRCTARPPLNFFFFFGGGGVVVTPRVDGLVNDMSLGVGGHSPPGCTPLPFFFFFFFI